MNSHPNYLKHLLVIAFMFLAFRLEAFIQGIAIVSPLPVTDETNVVLGIQIITGSSPPFLSKPTEVARDRNLTTITIYPDAGDLQAMSMLYVEVDLGKLSAGTNIYIVKLYPSGSPGGSDRLIVSGTVIVLPKLRVSKFNQSLLKIQWSDTVYGFQLETTSDETEPRKWIKYGTPTHYLHTSELVPIQHPQQFFRLVRETIKYP